MKPHPPLRIYKVNGCRAKGSQGPTCLREVGVSVQSLASLLQLITYGLYILQQLVYGHGFIVGTREHLSNTDSCNTWKALLNT